MLRRILSLIIKEFLTLWKDPKSRFVIAAPPLIQLVLFANAATFDVTHVALGVWVEDTAHPATELVSRFEGSTAFDVVAHFDNPGDVERALSAQRVKAVLHLGQTFSADVLSGRPAKVQLLLDGRRSNTALIVQNYAASILEAFQRQRSPKPDAGLQLETRAWFNPNYDSKWFILPGLTVLLTAVATILITALSVARERELGTFEQLLVTPLRPMEILLGKAIPPTCIGFVEANVIAGVAVVVYGVPFIGKILLFHVAVAAFAISTIGIGMVISSIARTQQQAILGVFIFLAPAIVLSGFATPIANMPLWSQELTRINPIAYMVRLTRGIFLEDVSWAIAWHQLWPMLLIGVVTQAYSTWLFARKLQ